MADLLWLQCSLSLKLNGINLQFALVPASRESQEKNHPRGGMETEKYVNTHTYFWICVFAHICIWDFQTCPLRRSSFRLPPTNTHWGSFYTEGIDSEHTWRGQTQICSTLCRTLRDCGLQGFPSHPFPLYRWSLVRSCPQSKHWAYSEIKIIKNFGFTLVSPRWGFGLVHTSKIKDVVCVAIKLLQKQHHWCKSLVQPAWQAIRTPAVLVCIKAPLSPSLWTWGQRSVGKILLPSFTVCWRSPVTTIRLRALMGTHRETSRRFLLRSQRLSACC